MRSKIIVVNSNILVYDKINNYNIGMLNNFQIYNDDFLKQCWFKNDQIIEFLVSLHSLDSKMYLVSDKFNREALGIMLKLINAKTKLDISQSILFITPDELKNFMRSNGEVIYIHSGLRFPITNEKVSCIDVREHQDNQNIMQEVKRLLELNTILSTIQELPVSSPEQQYLSNYTPNTDETLSENNAIQPQVDSNTLCNSSPHTIVAQKPWPDNHLIAPLSNVRIRIVPSCKVTHPRPFVAAIYNSNATSRGR